MKHIFIFLVCIIILIYNACIIILRKYNRQIINVFFEKKRKKNNIEHKYFIEHFEDIFSKYYYPSITNKYMKKINCCRQVKNEYSLLDKKVCEDILPKLKLNEKNSEKTIFEILDRIIPYIHYNDETIYSKDCFIVDCLHSKSANFPYFHTDIEWNTFYNNSGFQVWILLKEGKSKGKGNMFIMETPFVTTGKNIRIEEKKVSIYENGNEDNIFTELRDIKEFQPKVRYLDAKVGEVFIMNPNVFHTSDPRELKTERMALNFRVILKKDYYIKLYISNTRYSRIVLLRLELLRFYEFFSKHKIVVFKKNNKYLTSRLLY